MPAQNYVLLERIELNASAASVTFSNIPQTGYTDLKVVVSGRSTASAVNDNLWMKFNGDNASYSERVLYGSGSAAASGNSSGNADTRYLAPIPGATSTSSTFGNSEIYIPNYLSSNYKSVSLDGVAENNATAAYSQIQAILWSNTAAISSIQFGLITGSYVQYSTFSLYALAALGTTPTIAPKASGGNRIDYDGTYWIHTFLTSGAFVPAVGLSCDYLVVAGGGGGGGDNGAGGGAGGLRSTVTATGGGGSLESKLSLTSSTSYTVTIGAGGAGSPNNTASSGNNSVFGSITSTAGGGGGGNVNVGLTGGSGGGGSGANTPGNAAGGSGTANQGYAGGAGTINQNAGGGGGAGQIGETAIGTSANQGGKGGNGVATSITGSSVTYAGGGGGGGGGGNPALRGTGGTGGGGQGGHTTGITAGTVNTGGGGGGGAGAGAAGGSGIVIIRYLAA
jgi:hypothetical protein